VPRKKIFTLRRRAPSAGVLDTFQNIKEVNWRCLLNKCRPIML